MDAKSRWIYFLTWGISWVVLSALLVAFISRPGDDLFLDPGTWLATFPVAWTIALLVNRQRQLCAADPNPQRRRRSGVWIIPLINGVIQPLINGHLLKSSNAREWVFVGALSLLGFLLCLLQMRNLGRGAERHQVTP